MKRKLETLESLEAALMELNSAEEAGVFRRTPISISELEARKSQALHAGFRLRVWIPLAAAAALAIGTWGMLFQSEFRMIRSRMPMAVAPDLKTDTVGGLAFSGCLAGPGTSVNSTCRPIDQDADGDVDLADYRTIQLADASLRR